ncbi:response regulator transcription factor [Ideonella sp.]|uniref:response regulator transcription factor n=1 Tax=Ideonella sp. TaxID=1929293 RepID=UPI0035AEE43E
MLPKTLALIEDDQEYSEGLSRYLRELGVSVDAFADSNDLLAHADPYGYEFYVTDLMLPGVDGADLIKILRQRTNAGVLVVSGRLAPETFKQVITAGADMYLTKPVQFEQIALAIEAVCRRSVALDATQNVWRLDRRVGQLIAPDGARVDLSDADRSLVECFVEAKGEVVPRETLLQRLGRTDDPEASGGLNATVFRLRRRIERATPATVPLQTKSGVGYAFRAPLKAI